MREEKSGFQRIFGARKLGESSSFLRNTSWTMQQGFDRPNEGL